MHIISHIFFKGHPLQTHAQEHTPTRTHTHPQCSALLSGSVAQSKMSGKQIWKQAVGCFLFSSHSNRNQIHMMAWKKSCTGNTERSCMLVLPNPDIKEHRCTGATDQTEWTKRNRTSSQTEGAVWTGGETWATTLGGLIISIINRCYSGRRTVLLRDEIAGN